MLEKIEQIAEIPGPIEEITAYSRDLKDDYLIVYGLLEKVNYLITGDEDLTVLKQIKSLQILSPMEFLEVLALKG